MSGVQTDQSRNEVKYKSYMDRAYMDLEKTNQQLQRTRTDLQNASKAMNEKDVKLSSLNSQMEALKLQYEDKLNEYKAAQEKYNAEREAAFKRKSETANAQRDAEYRRQLNLLQEKLQNEPTANPVARRKLLSEFQEAVQQRQQNIAGTFQAPKHPKTYEEVVKQLENDGVRVIEENGDFMKAEQTPLPEAFQRYHRQRDAELRAACTDKLINDIIGAAAEETTAAPKKLELKKKKLGGLKIDVMAEEQHSGIAGDEQISDMSDIVDAVK